MSSPVGAPEITDLSHFSVSVQPIVDDFMKSVIADPIDYPVERRKKQIAHRAVSEFETACSRAENVISTSNPHVTADLRAVYSQAKDAFNLAAVTFNRANIRFDKRKQQFLRSHALNMSFLSPRALRRFEVWKEEAVAASPRMVQVAEVGFLGIVFTVFCLMMVGSWVSAGGGRVGGSGAKVNRYVRGKCFHSGMHTAGRKFVGWNLVEPEINTLERGIYNASTAEDGLGICLKGASRGVRERDLMERFDLERKCYDGDERDDCSVSQSNVHGAKIKVGFLESGKRMLVQALRGAIDHFLAYFKPVLVIEIATPVEGRGHGERKSGVERYGKRVVGRMVLYKVNVDHVRRVRDTVQSLRVWGMCRSLAEAVASMRYLRPVEWTDKH